jgi:cobalt-zinc-cadmium efflux system membrane fusion protein
MQMNYLSFTWTITLQFTFAHRRIPIRNFLLNALPLLRITELYMNKAALITGLIIMSAIQTCSASEAITITAAQIQALGIKTMPLPNKRFGDISGLPAQIIIPGNQLFVISTPLPAMIEQMLVGVGDEVRKGQPIAILQSPALAEVQRGLLQTSVQYRLAKENLLRDESLYKDGIISESRYRTTRALSMEAQAALSERKHMLQLSGMSDSAISQLQSGNSLSSRLTLSSPTDGVVLEKTASAGQRLDAAVAIFKIARVTQLAIEIQAPLAVTRDLKTGAAITIPAYGASGKLTAIGRGLTGTNQTVLLRGVILSGAENLRPGQFVETSVSTSGNNKGQWEVPNSAISRIDGHAVLFVKTAGGFDPYPITVLNQGATSSVISGAFKGDDMIAVAGVSALKASAMGIGGDQ